MFLKPSWKEKEVAMFKKILIPIDDSRCSTHAATLGLDLARQFNSSVFITHVIEDLPKIYQGGDWAEALLEQGERVLDKWRTKGEEQKIKLETSVVTSRDTAEGIIKTARENACDLIVMGTHGRKGLAHAFLGSVAERVTRLATIPVLLVRESKHTATPTWQRILVAVDGSTASRKALKVADQLAQTTGAELHLLHVIPDLPPPLVDPIGGGAVTASLTYENTLKELEHDAHIVMEVSRAEVETEKTVFHTARAQRERIADTVVRYASEHQCDLIVMGTHGRTGLNHLLLGSVAEGVAHTTPVPLLLIHVENELLVEPQEALSQPTSKPSSREPTSTL
jgi:nucleotide-binding universal stress UspA family protein